MRSHPILTTNRVLKRALAGYGFIVTGDKHLLDIGADGHMRILKSTHFLQLLQEGR